jgi:23S rRNA (cytosine1962-C5)-methyltransferase
VRGLKLDRAAESAVSRGYPWVFRDALQGEAEVGEPVRLLDRKGRTAGWGLYDDGPIAVRVLGRHPESIPGLVRQRVARAAALRGRVVPPDTDCYRLVNAAGDGLPGVVVDVYGGLVVLRLYSRAWESHLDALVDALVDTLEGARTVLRRLGVGRVDGAEGGVTLSGPEPPETLVVRENGLKLLVRPLVGQKTGLFLDQRAARRRAGALARDLEVLNLFSYSGGFSLYAAAGGARRVTSVDISPGALEDARESFRLNGLDPGDHGFEVADVFKWSPAKRADFVICDPPHLSRGRGADEAARRAYQDLAARVGAWVPDGGLLFTFSCTARLSRGQWEAAVEEGLRRAGRWAALERAEAPADHPVALAHPEGRYLKSLLLARL